MLEKNLETWLDKYNIKLRTTKYFWKYIENWKKESIDDFEEFLKEIDITLKDINPHSLKLEFEFAQISIYYLLGTESHNHYEVLVCVAVKKRNKKLFSYNACFSPSGKFIDDFIKDINSSTIV
ncbi:hypothetical protein [Tepidibacter formicigenes]|jgi:hypothetical protein|uniref:Uncharacterized protein n=1 Tax=Tepidibacter formicigenes DSM 15518 TaxID=1123349 RepID=A0A1M6PSG8_9FIRM|nr:hypothetical protein [Tepidibacter formicigenes]SHK10913.1 hypothetical protein SAMN02744037_01638 [Tepidibacter formicigenes DSM 15518]